MKLKVTPILDIAFKMDNGQTGVIPFYNVQVKVGIKKKNHFVNWTFGSCPDGGELSFENEIGHIKLAQLTLNPSTEKVFTRVIKHGDIVGKIRATLRDLPINHSVLFVLPKNKDDDDSLFYDALDLWKNGAISKNIHKPKPASFFGYKVKQPFFESSDT